MSLNTSPRARPHRRRPGSTDPARPGPGRPSGCGGLADGGRRGRLGRRHCWPSTSTRSTGELLAGSTR